MTPAIVPLSPGERPTEPGWYVVVFAEDPAAPMILEATEDALYTSDDRNVLPDRFNFIARIYPDRIALAGEER